MSQWRCAAPTWLLRLVGLLPFTGRPNISADEHLWIKIAALAIFETSHDRVENLPSSEITVFKPTGTKIGPTPSSALERALTEGASLETILGISPQKCRQIERAGVERAIRDALPEPSPSEIARCK